MSAFSSFVLCNFSSLFFPFPCERERNPSVLARRVKPLSPFNIITADCLSLIKPGVTYFVNCRHFRFSNTLRHGSLRACAKVIVSIQGERVYIRYGFRPFYAKNLLSFSLSLYALAFAVLER